MQTQLSTLLPRPQNFPFRYAVCPLGHVTHELLACDVRSSCWSDDNNTRRAWGFPWRGPCESQRNYPPSFTCADGVTHVPYSLVCNHGDDCHDGSDETFCTFPACQGQRPLQCGASAQVQDRQGWGNEEGSGRQYSIHTTHLMYDAGFQY